MDVQSTDKKVNEITPALFAVAPDAPSMAQQKVHAPVTTTCNHLSRIHILNSGACLHCVKTRCWCLTPRTRHTALHAMFKQGPSMASLAAVLL